MKRLKLIAQGALVSVFLTGGAISQTWQPPAEIAPKATATTPAAPSAAPVPEQAASEKIAQTPAKSREAKTKDCKAQSAAKGLHGAERKKFIEECKNS